MPNVTLLQTPQEPAPVVSQAEPGQIDLMRDLAQRIAPMHVLRHTGFRPVAFNGHLLNTVSGIDQVLPYWYEINVYQDVLGAYVSDIRLFAKGVGTVDLFRVAEHEDLEALYSYFENYDPCGDLPPIRFDAAATSAAALTLRAIEVQAGMQRITDHYRATVGALLDALAG
jgi:hypothetical protein